jgi:hypothetical protein
MKNGIRTTEFWLVAGVMLFALLVAFGGLTPEKVQITTVKLRETTAALPELINALQTLAENLGPLLIAAGSVWAYLKRRTELKQEKEVIK